MAPQNRDLLIEDCRLLFRNFSGEKMQFNAAGDRNFCIALPNDLASSMEKDGWNVKYLKAREEGDEPQGYIKVKVNFSGRPPKVVMVTSRNKTTLDEHTAGLLDYADILTADVIINPYDWVLDSGATGRTAYLQSIFVTIRESELDRKYQDIPDAVPSMHYDYDQMTGEAA